MWRSWLNWLEYSKHAEADQRAVGSTSHHDSVPHRHQDSGRVLSTKVCPWRELFHRSRDPIYQGRVARCLLMLGRSYAFLLSTLQPVRLDCWRDCYCFAGVQGCCDWPVMRAKTSDCVKPRCPQKSPYR